MTSDIGHGWRDRSTLNQHILRQPAPAPRVLAIDQRRGHGWRLAEPLRSNARGPCTIFGCCRIGEQWRLRLGARANVDDTADSRHTARLASHGRRQALSVATSNRHALRWCDLQRELRYLRQCHHRSATVSERLRPHFSRPPAVRGTPAYLVGRRSSGVHDLRAAVRALQSQGLIGALAHGSLRPRRWPTLTDPACRNPAQIGGLPALCLLCWSERMLLAQKDEESK